MTAIAIVFLVLAAVSGVSSGLGITDWAFGLPVACIGVIVADAFYRIGKLRARRRARKVAAAVRGEVTPEDLLKERIRQVAHSVDDTNAA